MLHQGEGEGVRVRGSVMSSVVLWKLNLGYYLLVDYP